MPRVSLRLVLALLICIMSLACALIAFLPTYLSGVESVSSTVSNLRNVSISKAQSDVRRLLDAPLLQLRQAYDLFHAEMMDPSNQTQVARYLVDTVGFNKGKISAVTVSLFNKSSISEDPVTKLFSGIQMINFQYVDTALIATDIHIATIVNNATHSGLQLSGINPITLEYYSTPFSLYRPLPQSFFSQQAAGVLNNRDAELNFPTYPEVRLGYRSPERVLRTFMLPANVILRGPDGVVSGSLQMNLLTTDFSRVLADLGLRTHGSAVCYDASSEITVGTSWGEVLFELGVNPLDLTHPGWERMLLKTLQNISDNDFIRTEVVPAVGYSQLIDTTTDPYPTLSDKINTETHGPTFVDNLEIREVGVRLRVLIAMPESDFTGEIVKSRTAAISGAIAAIVVTLVLAILIAHLLISPLVVLEGKMALAARFQDDGGEEVGTEDEGSKTSFLSEVANLQLSYFRMRDELNRAKVYLPQSVLKSVLGTTSESDDEGEVGGLTSLGGGSSTLHPPAPAGSGRRPRGKSRSGDGGSSRLSSSGNTISDARSGRSSAYVGGVPAAPVTAGGLNTALSVVQKRVAIVVFNLTDFSTHQASDMSSLQTRYLDTITKHVKANKAMIDYFQGDRVVCSFNAVKSVAVFVRRAIHTALAVVGELEKDPHMPRCTAGLSSGSAFVGNMGNSEARRFCIVGQVVVQALLLERLNKHFKGETKILAPAFALSGYETDFDLQSVGIIKIPRRKSENEPMIVTSVEGAKSQEQQDEWMYQMEEREKQNPYVAGNAIFETILSSGVPEARSLINSLTSPQSPGAAAEVMSQQPAERGEKISLGGSFSPSATNATTLNPPHSVPEEEAEISAGTPANSASPQKAAAEISPGASFISKEGKTIVIPSSATSQPRIGFLNAVATVEAAEASNSSEPIGIGLQSLGECFF